MQKMLCYLVDFKTKYHETKRISDRWARQDAVSPSSVGSARDTGRGPSRANAVRSVDFNRVLMYWGTVRRVFEEEQKGAERADYGSLLIERLAQRLEPGYGSGFSKRQLHFSVQFYRTYPKVNALRSQLNWKQHICGNPVHPENPQRVCGNRKKSTRRLSRCSPRIPRRTEFS